MTTKKQRREAVAKKREKFMAELQAEGLKAQKWDQQRRARKAEKAKLTEDEKSKREKTTEALAKLLPKEQTVDWDIDANRPAIDLTRIPA